MLWFLTIVRAETTHNTQLQSSWVIQHGNCAGTVKKKSSIAAATRIANVALLQLSSCTAGIRACQRIHLPHDVRESILLVSKRKCDILCKYVSETSTTSTADAAAPLAQDESFVIRPWIGEKPLNRSNWVDSSQTVLCHTSAAIAHMRKMEQDQSLNTDGDQ